MTPTLSILQAQAELQQEIRKSRFLAQAAPVESADAALAFIARASTADATHNCWACRIGQHYRFSDDGEPGGSAGRPILAAIDGQAIDRVALVVTRWYGGIKLGIGGLMRAYGGVAAECLRRAEKQRLIERVRIHVACGFAAAPLVYARLQEFDATRHAERATSDGTELVLDLPLEKVPALRAFVRDITRGRGSVRVST